MNIIIIFAMDLTIGYFIVFTDNNLFIDNNIVTMLYYELFRKWNLTTTNDKITIIMSVM